MLAQALRSSLETTGQFKLTLHQLSSWLILPALDYEASLGNRASVPRGTHKLKVCRTSKRVWSIFSQRSCCSSLALQRGSKLKIDQRMSRALSPVLGVCRFTSLPSTALLEGSLDLEVTK